MRPNTSTQRWFAAAVCVLATASYAAAEEGVVRISDADKRPGVVRMNAPQRPVIQQTAYGTAGYSGAAFSPAMAANAQRYQSAMAQQAYRQQSMGQPPVYQPISFSSGHAGCGTEGCGVQGCGPEGCDIYGNDRCQSGNCDGCPSGRDSRKMGDKAANAMSVCQKITTTACVRCLLAPFRMMDVLAGQLAGGVDNSSTFCRAISGCRTLCSAG